MINYYDLIFSDNGLKDASFIFISNKDLKFITMSNREVFEEGRDVDIDQLNEEKLRKLMPLQGYTGTNVDIQ